VNYRDFIESERFDSALFELISKTSVELPEDVTTALNMAYQREDESSTARLLLSRYIENLKLAKERKVPLCQDTGMPVFYITMPECLSMEKIIKKIESAIARATEEQYLRPNAVDPVTGRNSSNNTGAGFPLIHFKEEKGKDLEIALILKGGGSENVSCQYALPHEELDAGRDLEGVRRVVIDAVKSAGGRGCPPGVVGVCIGGDRESSYRGAKRQFLRNLDDINPDHRLAALEKTLTDDLNSLGIGPQGLGGRSTVLGVKIGTLHRLPACYFVTVSYMCWAFRRRRLIINPEGGYRVV